MADTAVPLIATPHASTAASSGRMRIQSVDLIRGLVMVVMALDHVRDFVTDTTFDPTDLATTTPALFLTRWVTHFCAPTFVFLAGCSAFLLGSTGKPRAELSRFLVTRGLWLVVLELTVVAWIFNFHEAGVGVIWAIGWSMVVLAALVWLPRWAIATFAAVMIAGHNTLDGIHGGFLWTVLHDQNYVTILGWKLLIFYPLVPWIGVMAAGYALGPIFQRPPDERRRRLVWLGLGAVVLFIVLRWLNVYGDPQPWSHQKSAVFTALSFLNLTKYPPSLLYLLVTLGPALLGLAALDRVQVGAEHPLVVFGRVPFFYYLLHLAVIRVVAIAILFAGGYGLASLGASPDVHPAGSGLSLGWVYVVWALVVIALYWPCRWYAGLKRRSRNPLLSYL